MRLALLAALVSVLLLPRPARAHCTDPEVVRPLFRPGAPDELQLQLSFGAALSTDGGRSWRLQCEEVYQQPGDDLGPEALALTPAGKLVVAHFLYGVLTSGPTNRGCTYDPATGLEGAGSVRDVLLDPRAPDERLFVVLDDELRASDDGGRTVATKVAAFPGQTLLRGGVVGAAGQPIVIPGFDPTGRFFAYAADGARFVRVASPFGRDDVVLRGALADGRVLAVRGVDDDGDGTPDRDEAVAVTFAGTTAQATSLFRPATPSRLSIAVDGTGGVWVGVRETGELHRSADGGQTWAPVEGRHPHFRCLETRGNELWACGNNLKAGDDFALGVSQDGGATWQKRFAFGELCDALPCVRATCAGVFRSTCVPGLCGAVLPVDGGPPVILDAATDAPAAAPTGGGCCRTGGGPRSGTATVLVVAAVLAWLARQRPRAGGKRSTHGAPLLADEVRARGLLDR